MTAMDALIDEIEAFLANHGMPPSTFGQQAIGDGKLVFDLREGRDLRSRTVERIRNYMREYRPPNPNHRGSRSERCVA